MTETEPSPPAAGTDALEGAIEYEHGAAACVMVNVLAPTATVPVRDVVVGFAATVYETLPLPLPVAPLLTVIHEELLAAVHAQPVAAVTLMVPAPPSAATLADVAVIAGAQAAPA